MEYHISHYLLECPPPPSQLLNGHVLSIFFFKFDKHYAKTERFFGLPSNNKHMNTVIKKFNKLRKKLQANTTVIQELANTHFHEQAPIMVKVS